MFLRVLTKIEVHRVYLCVLAEHLWDHNGRLTHSGGGREMGRRREEQKEENNQCNCFKDVHPKVRGVIGVKGQPFSTENRAREGTHLYMQYIQILYMNVLPLQNSLLHSECWESLCAGPFVSPLASLLHA